MSMTKTATKMMVTGVGGEFFGDNNKSDPSDSNSEVRLCHFVTNGCYQRSKFRLLGILEELSPTTVTIIPLVTVCSPKFFISMIVCNKCVQHSDLSPTLVINITA